MSTPKNSGPEHTIATAGNMVNMLTEVFELQNRNVVKIG